MNIISFETYRLIRERREQEKGYRDRLLAMDKAELLEELLRYHESYRNDPLDLNATIRGEHLLNILEARAELREMRELAQEFKTKLKIRMYQQIQAMKC